jgi:hypothetical protein
MIICLLATKRDLETNAPDASVCPRLDERLQISLVISWAATPQPQSLINATVFDVGSVVIV